MQVNSISAAQSFQGANGAKMSGKKKAVIAAAATATVAAAAVAGLAIAGRKVQVADDAKLFSKIGAYIKEGFTIAKNFATDKFSKVSEAVKGHLGKGAKDTAAAAQEAAEDVVG